jgi:hypothetical protein
MVGKISCPCRAKAEAEEDSQSAFQCSKHDESNAAMEEIRSFLNSLDIFLHFSSETANSLVKIAL